MKKYFGNTKIKKVTKNELRSIIKIAANREAMHCLPDRDDRPFKLYQLYRLVLEQLEMQKCDKEISEDLIVFAMNDLISQKIRNNDVDLKCF